MMFDHPLGATDRLRDQRRTAWIPPRAHATSTASLKLGAWLERFPQDVLQHPPGASHTCLEKGRGSQEKGAPGGGALSMTTSELVKRRDVRGLLSSQVVLVALARSSSAPAFVKWITCTQ